MLDPPHPNRFAAAFLLADMRRGGVREKERADSCRREVVCFLPLTTEPHRKQHLARCFCAEPLLVLSFVAAATF